MDVRVGDVLEMRKDHPCGGNTFTVTRTGMDFRLVCNTCGREFMIPRAKAEKNIRKIIRPSQSEGAQNKDDRKA